MQPQELSSIAVKMNQLMNNIFVLLHHRSPSCLATGWAKKNRTCLSVDNSVMVSGRKTCNRSKVSECCKE